MSRLTRIPAGNADIGLVDSGYVSGIEPLADNPSKCRIHLAGSTIVCNATVEEAAKALRLSTGPAAGMDYEQMHQLLLDAAEAVLSAWRVGGEQLHESIHALDMEVASQKGAMFE